MGKTKKSKREIKRKLQSKIKKLKRRIEEYSSSESSDSSSSSEFSDSVRSEEETPKTTEGPVDTLPDTHPDIISILGCDPRDSNSEGPEVHEQIANRWTSVVNCGIDKAERKTLMDKYPIIKNCKSLSAPVLNPELKTIIGENSNRQDMFLARIQDQLGCAISALSGPLNELFCSPTTETNLTLLRLVESAKLLTDLHHSLSLHRRFMILPSLKPDIRRIIEDFPIEQLLFGEKFTDKVKNSKDILKSSMDLKMNLPFSKSQPSSSGYQQFKTNPKNFKRTQNRPPRLKGKEREGRKLQRRGSGRDARSRSNRVR
ncbi:uncharacterized protein isoform X2 [Leptinotarsa decemlineata]|uniref:uncharacterized protein isoform X2 n=1 Tax=Leptinotarsa decemlineata TaxID=7539 RepID=UPI003D3060A7